MVITVENDIAIRVEGLSKVYKIYDTPLDRMKEALHPFHKRYSSDFYALQDVSFTLKRGETMGFVGKNGAGKSTLLKILTGVLTPTCGTVEVNGRVASLLELGAGFNPEMTGIENIYMNGTIMGCSRTEMDERLQDIVDFADIGDFIHQPVKMYSSGMFARLAFAVNAFVEPDILIVDEALSVGDVFFQTKCMDRMKQMMDRGVTVLFVSHDSFAIKNLCSRAILLDHGHLLMDATSSEVIEEYRRLQLEARQTILKAAPVEPAPIEAEPGEAVSQAAPPVQGNEDNAVFLHNAAYQRIQNGRLGFSNVQLLDQAEKPVEGVIYGQEVILRMVVEICDPAPVLGTGYHIRNKDGVDVVYSDLQLDDALIYDVKKGERYVIDYHFQMNLREGQYNLACVASVPIDLAARKVECCDFVPCAVQFTVGTNDCEMGGYVHWENKVSVKRV